MSSTSVTASAVMNTANSDFTLQSWLTEVDGLSALLAEIIRVKVLAALILGYLGLDGRERVNYFLDRKLSPSPSFVLSYEPTICNYKMLLQLVLITLMSSGCFDFRFKENYIIIMLHEREIVKINNEYAIHSGEFMRAAEQALQILRKDEICSKYLCLSMDDLQNLKPTLSLSRDLVNDLEAAQIKGIEGDSKKRATGFLLSMGDKVLPFKLLSCQKKLFDLQLDVQKIAEDVICHLKLNGLPLSETSNPGKGRTEEEAIDDVLTKSSQYLLKMTNTLTHREFRIIEMELLRRSLPPETHVHANILQHNCSVDLM